MKYLYVWLTIGVVQAVFLALVAMLYHVRATRRGGTWLGSGDGGASAGGSEGEWGALGRAGVRRAASSWFWWRRMAAARRLSVVADEQDREVIRRLLVDPNPGVQGAATAALLRYADDDLLSLVIDGLAARSAAVRRYQMGVLRQRREMVAPLLLKRLNANEAPAQLHAYIGLTDLLGSWECLEVVSRLSIHQHPDVRLAVARVLPMLSDDTAVIKLLTMIRDPDWRVRAQAVRGLGNLQNERAVPELMRALTDQSWWVRFRAGLALATIGAAGHKALEEAQALPDRYARDMAALVSGLSASNIAELSEG